MPDKPEKKILEEILVRETSVDNVEKINRLVIILQPIFQFLYVLSYQLKLQAEVHKRIKTQMG